MLNIVCLNFRSRYPDLYVDRLYSMTRRNLSTPFRFTCITDHRRELHPDIVQVCCDDLGEGRGSRNKLRLFDPDLLSLESILYLDVTLVVKGPLDTLVNRCRGRDFVTVRDWKYESFNSCVMWITHSERTRTVWDAYRSGKRFDQVVDGGDQDFIYSVFRENGWLDDVAYFAPETIASFKKLLELHKTDRQAAYAAADAAAIVKFHGHPKPHELLNPLLRLKYIHPLGPIHPVPDWNFLVSGVRQWWR